MEGSRLSLVEFLDQAVLPALFEQLDQAFPEFGWRRTGRGWVASNREHTKAAPISARPDRVVCHRPFGFLVHGGSPMTWLAYVRGGVQPTGQDFVAAVKDLAGRAGVAFPEREATVAELEAAAKRERRKAIMEAFLGVVTAEPGAAVEKYLEKRGFTGEQAKELDLGTYPRVGEVRTALEKAGFKADEIEASGLVADGRWEGRLVGPWRDRWGQLGTFWARAVDGAEPKYLYLSAEKGFGRTKASLVAAGLDVAMGCPEGRQDLVVVEGVLDVLTLQARGMKNVAAIGGAGAELSVERLEALGRFGVEQVTLALDNDQAGKAGVLAVLAHAAEARGAVPRLWILPPEFLGDAKDPDALVREEGVDAFRVCLQHRQSGSLYSCLAPLAGITAASPQGERLAAIEAVAKAIEGLRGPLAAVHADEAIKEAARRTGFGPEALSTLFEEAERRRRRETLERQGTELLQEAMEELRARKEPPEAVLARARDRIGFASGAVADEPILFSLDRVIKESAGASAGRRSGWQALDRQDVQFNPGELALIGARTGHCKTTFMVNLLLNWLEMEKASDEVFLFYSSEETEPRITHRLLAILSTRAELEHLKLDFSPDPYERAWTANEVRDYYRAGTKAREADYEWPLSTGLERAEATLRKLTQGHRLYVIHRPGWTADDLATHARHVARARDVAGVFVDYLQRIPPPAGKYDRPDLERTAVARALRHLAIDVAAPVVVGAQINREAVRGKDVPPGAYRDDKVRRAIRKRRPQLHHLREGGSEQEADLVLGLMNFRADYEQDDEGERREGAGDVPAVTRLEAGTLKNRYGTTGTWGSLAFYAKYGVLVDVGDGSDE